MLNAKQATRIALRALLIFSVSAFSAEPSFAEKDWTDRLSRTEIKHLAMARGFVLGQKHTLDAISAKYPFLHAAATLAEKKFMLNFGASIASMDQWVVDMHSEEELEKLKEKILRETASSMKNLGLSEETARDFIQVVTDRAGGDIESPIFETLLTFNPEYAKNPHREFLEGYKYSQNGEGKAKGIGFSLYVPVSWKGREGEHPNIVRHFTNRNGHGPAFFNLSVRDLPHSLKSGITENDIEEMLDPANVQNLLPENVVALSSEKIYIQGLPGLRVQRQAEQALLEHTIVSEIVHYFLFYKEKWIILSGGVNISVGDFKTDDVGLKKYKKVFDLMASSLVIPSRWNSP